MQEEKIKKDNKIIRYGKKVIALIIMLVFMSFCCIVITSSESLLIVFLVFIRYFTYTVVAFLIIELISVLNCHARLNKLLLQKIVLIFIVAVAVTLILIGLPHQQ